jgi:hypothetical protein
MTDAPEISVCCYVPQWDFLDFLAEEAKRFPAFQRNMEAGVRDLTVEGGDRPRIGEHYENVAAICCAASGKRAVSAPLRRPPDRPGLSPRECKCSGCRLTGS